MSELNSKVVEAFDFALRQIEELRSQGIEINIFPSYSKDDAETVEKYQEDGVLPHEKWCQVSFKILNSRDLNLVRKIESSIRQIYGINFDTGFGGGFREWELDWSFAIKPE